MYHCTSLTNLMGTEPWRVDVQQGLLVLWIKTYGAFIKHEEVLDHGIGGQENEMPTGV